MTTFPTLVPNAINFDMGRANISAAPTFAGPVRFRHSQRVNNQQLRLTYRGLNQAQVEELRTHFYTVQSSFQYFSVPDAIWGGLSVVPEGSLCRYAAPFDEEHTGLHYNVTVSLNIIDSVVLLYILDGGGAQQPAFAERRRTFAFNGYEPFILDCDGADVTATLVLNGGAASL